MKKIILLGVLSLSLVNMNAAAASSPNLAGAAVGAVGAGLVIYGVGSLGLMNAEDTGKATVVGAMVVGLSGLLIGPGPAAALGGGLGTLAFGFAAVGFYGSYLAFGADDLLVKSGRALSLAAVSAFVTFTGMRQMRVTP